MTRVIRELDWCRLALAGACTRRDEQYSAQIIQSLSALDIECFSRFLVEEGLGPIWYDFICSQNSSELHNFFQNRGGFSLIKQSRLAAAGLYQAQFSALQRIDKVFSARGILYAVMKGALIRELAYKDPAVRSSCDIDILVTHDQRREAASVLVDEGFAMHPNSDNLSHEASFVRGPVEIDLHWDILRPGRTPKDFATTLLQSRQRLSEFWGLQDVNAAYLMLVHPAFAKHVCSPSMGLNRVADFMLWLRIRSIDWNAVLELLERSGLTTAAWVQLKWFSHILKPSSLPIPDWIEGRLQPGPRRTRYLQYWLMNDLPSRWSHIPGTVQIGFTMALHDRPSDALRAVRGLIAARRAQASDIKSQFSALIPRSDR